MLANISLVHHIMAVGWTEYRILCHGVISVFRATTQLSVFNAAPTVKWPHQNSELKIITEKPLTKKATEKDH